SANSSADIVATVKIKLARLVNLSAMTQIVSYPLFVSGRPVIKSIPMKDHRPVGISSGCRSPGAFPVRYLFL
ncbi:hypothetical protein PHMEG_00019384, partial [Phytophthora megakarya]